MYERTSLRIATEARPVCNSFGISLSEASCQQVVWGVRLDKGRARQGVTSLGVLGNRRLKATSKASSFGCHFP